MICPKLDTHITQTNIPLSFEPHWYIVDNFRCKSLFWFRITRQLLPCLPFRFNKQKICQSCLRGQYRWTLAAVKSLAIRITAKFVGRRQLRNAVYEMPFCTSNCCFIHKRWRLVCSFFCSRICFLKRSKWSCTWICSGVNWLSLPKLMTHLKTINSLKDV